MSDIPIPVSAAKAQLTELVRRAQAGDDVVLMASRRCAWWPSPRQLSAAKAELARLWNAETEDELQRLSDWAELIDAYEARALRPPAGDRVDPVAIIVAEMAMSGRSRADLAAVIGQNCATEILNRRRALTLPMTRALHAAWGLPADLLIAEYATA